MVSQALANLLTRPTGFQALGMTMEAKRITLKARKASRAIATMHQGSKKL